MNKDYFDKLNIIKSEYEIIVEENFDSIDWFQLQMMSENDINNILKLSSKTINKKTTLIYDTLNLVKLKEAISKYKVSFKDILLSIVDLFEGLENYYLDKERVILLDEYLYFDADINEVFLMYVPVKNVGIEKNLLEFLKEFVRKNLILEPNNVEDILVMNIINKVEGIEELKLELLKIYSLTNKVEYPNLNNTQIYEKLEEDKKDRENNGNSAKNYFKKINISVAEKLIFLIIYILLFSIFAMILYIFDLFTPIFLIALTLLDGIFIFLIRKIYYFYKNKKISKYDIEQNLHDEKNFLNINSNKEIVSENGERTILLNDSINKLNLFNLETGEKLGFDFSDRNEILIGRMENSDLFISSKLIGRKHAKISRIEGKFFLIDLDSLNGTFVNGKKIDTATMLKNGDVLCFSNFKYSIGY